MRLKELYIKEYKNLKDLKVKFSDKSFWDVIIGKNGSGKSNLLEAIVEIFKFLENDEEVFKFEFSIVYTLRGEEFKINYEKGKLSLNGVEKRIIKSDLPENVMIYYSGHNDRVSSIVDSYEKDYLKKIKGNNLKELRFIFGLNKSHKSLVLLSLLVDNCKNEVINDLFNKLELNNENIEIKFHFKAPYYIDNKGKLNSWDDNPFWGIKGYLKDFLYELDKNKSHSEKIRKEGFFFDDQSYILYIKLSDLKKITFTMKLTKSKLFQYFDDMRLINLLNTGEIGFETLENSSVSYKNLSDGEFQSVFIEGIMSIFPERHMTTFLDEPDAFLHPEWQLHFLDNFNDNIQSECYNYILFCTHNASTLAPSTRQDVLLMNNNCSPIKCCSVNKNFAIKELSSGLMVLDETESTLSIINRLKMEDKPVFFTEGKSDIKIIETAWRKLFKSPIPFITLHAFNDINLRKVVTDEDVHNQVSGNPIFGLFDFDNAYNEWNGIKSEKNIETDPMRGLSKKINGKNGFVFLLPIPDVDEIKQLVIKDETIQETWKNESKLYIELLFWGYPETESFFGKQKCPGGERIVFKNSDKKTKFAEEIIPTLPKEAFEVFRPMFEFIQSTINS